MTGLEAIVKAGLIAAIVQETGRRGFTHAELAGRSGLPRSAAHPVGERNPFRVEIEEREPIFPC